MTLIEKYSDFSEGCRNYEDQNILENKEFSRKLKLKIIEEKQTEDSGANTKGGLENSHNRVKNKSVKQHKKNE